MLKKMEVEGSLCWNDGALHIIHFVERQQLVPSETPEAIRERVQQFRERHRVTGNPLQPLSPSPLESPKPLKGKENENTDNKDREIEKGRYVTTENPLQQSLRNDKTVTPILSVTGQEFIKILSKLAGWVFDEEDDTNWVADFLNDFPDTDLMMLKGCVDFHSSKPGANKGAWKNRFRNWVKHEREWKAKEKRSGEEKGGVYHGERRGEGGPDVGRRPDAHQPDTTKYPFKRVISGENTDEENRTV
jgi:hypothetical protein